MQTYGEMVIGSIPLVGQVPRSWRKTRVLEFAKERKEFAKDGSEQLLSISEYFGVAPRNEKFIDSEGGSRDGSTIGYRIVRKYDLAMNYMLAWKGAQGVSNYDGVVSPAYAVFELDQTVVDPRFIHHLFRSELFQKYFKSQSRGIIDSRLRLYPETLLHSSVNIPNKMNQQKIAAFLDSETTKIDSLIAKQQCLLELLEEKRRATITRAVTRGLNTNAELKDTGIKWLSQVPIHWTIRKLGALARLVVGSTPSTADSAAFDGDQVWVTIGDMNQKNISKSKQMLTEQAVKDKNMELIPKGSLLFSFKLSVGKVGYANVNLYTNEAIAAFLPNDLVKADFLYYAAQTYFINEANTNIYGAALFNQELLRRVRVAFPDTQEQGRIVEFLENEEAKITATTKATLKQIDLLKERRTSLISSAVTGKIKV